ncbi:MAG: hypothetical protein AB7Q23_10590 [Hyphomonadaceae bacterium]
MAHIKAAAARLKNPWRSIAVNSSKKPRHGAGAFALEVIAALRSNKNAQNAHIVRKWILKGLGDER